MQKTEKHCKNQCFCYRKTTKISPKTGPKTQKSASGPGHLRNRKKDVANQKIEVKKLKNTGFFHFSLADFGRARSRTGVFRTVFYSVFWRRASRPIKNRRFWPKNAPPPGKPVTFYECHPEDHAPAPSVRADFLPASGSAPHRGSPRPGESRSGRHHRNDGGAWPSRAEVTGGTTGPGVPGSQEYPGNILGISGGCMGRYWSSGHETWLGNSQTKMMDFPLPRLIIEAWVMLGYVGMGSLQNSKRSSGWLQGGSGVLHRIFLCFISDQRCGLHNSMMNCVPATPISCYTDITQTGCFTTKYWEKWLFCFAVL